jgi:hypothetical protein
MSCIGLRWQSLVKEMALSIPSFRQKKSSLFSGETLYYSPKRDLHEADAPAGNGLHGSTPKVPEDEEDASSSSSSSSSSSDDSSVLSDGRKRRRRRRVSPLPVCEKDEEPRFKIRTPAFRRMEEKMIRSLLRRDRIWTNLYKNCRNIKRSTYLQQIEDREYATRQRIIDKWIKKLYQKELYDSDTVEQLRLHWNSLLVPEERLSKKVTHPAPSKRNLWWWTDASPLQIAIYTLLPATCSIIVHSIVHVVLYDGVTVSLGALKEQVLRVRPPLSESRSLVDLLWSCSCFVLGVALLRSTGDLYYWSSKSCATMVKLDYQNRRQLLTMSRDPRHHSLLTRIVMWMRKYNMVRAMTFLLGYTCCYVATGDLLHFLKTLSIHWVFPYWNQSILSNLPSTLHMNKHGTCLAPRDSHESVCSHSCQEELSSRGMLKLYH